MTVDGIMTTSNDLKIVNFFCPDKEVYSLLTHVAFTMGYEECMEYLGEKGWYIPPDQFKAFQKVLDIQCDLDIGRRQDERNYHSVEVV